MISECIPCVACSGTCPQVWRSCKSYRHLLRTSSVAAPGSWSHSSCTRCCLRPTPPTCAEVQNIPLQKLNAPPHTHTRCCVCTELTCWLRSGTSTPCTASWQGQRPSSPSGDTWCRAARTGSELAFSEFLVLFSKIKSELLTPPHIFKQWARYRSADQHMMHLKPYVVLFAKTSDCLNKHISSSSLVTCFFVNCIGAVFKMN